MIYGDEPEPANQQPKRYEYALSPTDNGVFGSTAMMPDMNAVIQSANLYIYCRSNPVQYTDSTGNFILTCLIVGAIAGAIIGATVGGINAYDKATESGATGWDRVGQTVAGALRGAVVGGIIGGIVGGFIGFAASAGAIAGGGSAVLAGIGVKGGAVALGAVAAGTVEAGVTLGVGVSLGLMMARTRKSNGYYGEKYSRDHDPDHAHFKGPNTDVRLGPDGKPLPGEPSLGSQARKALKRLVEEIAGLFQK